jgi:hypothetical protein
LAITQALGLGQVNPSFFVSAASLWPSITRLIRAKGRVENKFFMVFVCGCGEFQNLLPRFNYMLYSIDSTSSTSESGKFSVKQTVPIPTRNAADIAPTAGTLFRWLYVPGFHRVYASIVFTQFFG